MRSQKGKNTMPKRQNRYLSGGKIETGIRNGGGNSHVSRPDHVTQNKEHICDDCGVNTKALRQHADKMLCWSCKASTIKD